MNDPSLDPKKYQAPQDGKIDLQRIKTVFGGDFSRFYEEHHDLIWLLSGFLILILTMFCWRPWMDKQHQIHGILSTLNSTRMLELKLENTNGFKLFIISGTKIVPVKHDSLSKTFKINWNKAKVLSNDSYAFQLYLPNSFYKDKVFSLEELQPMLNTKSDQPQLILTASGIQLFLQVLDQKDDQILCLISYNVLEEQGVFRN